MKSLKSKINLLVILIWSISSTIGKTEDAIFIEKNEKAPYSGVLFSETRAREIRSDLLEADKTAIRLESASFKAENLAHVVKLKDSEIELYKTQNQRLVESSKTSETMKFVWFGLGILATGAAVYGARGLSK